MACQTSSNAAVIYVRRSSCREACNSFLLNNWQHVIFLISLFLLLFVAFLLSVAPPSVSARAAILAGFSSNVIVGVLAFVNAAAPIGFALLAIGSIYRSLYNYLALLYRNTDFEDEAEAATAWTVSRFLGSLAAKQVSLIGSIGVSSVLLTYFLLVSTY